MRAMPAWLLPDHTSDLLPTEALRLERLRRRLLDLYASYGYALFQPPIFEHAESLGVKGDADLDRRSFRFPDPLSGRLLGLRADITPQAARVDAHLLGDGGINRLCYAASVVHALPAGLLSSREPIQLGCELFGHSGLEADLEIQELALASLDAAGMGVVHLNLTDRAIFRALIQDDPQLQSVEQAVVSALQAKDGVALSAAMAELSPATQQALQSLLSLYGPPLGESGVLARARQTLPPTPAILASLDRLQRMAESPLFQTHPQCRLSLDLADLYGWQYHNGIMFSIFCPGHPDAVIRGGRYDGMGEAFGRSRPATGFSLELRALTELADHGVEPESSVAAPWLQDASLREAIAQIRAQGRAVVCLPEQAFDQWAGPRLVQTAGLWQVAPAVVPSSD